MGRAIGAASETTSSLHPNRLGGCYNNHVPTLDSQESLSTVSATPWQVMGVGNVDRKPGVATYTLYNPDSDRVPFKTVHYGAKKGFQL